MASSNEPYEEPADDATEPLELSVPRFAGLEGHLRASLAEHERRLRQSILLNPVENFPFAADLAPASGVLHGLYNSDKVRSTHQAIETPIQFAGRAQISADVREIYSAWADALEASDATLRMLSGLHAHVVLFMSVARAGDSVLILPEEAGGHMSGRNIVTRLGLRAVDMVVDGENMRVDMDRTLALCSAERPDFVLVDRSEGLVFEDFSPLAAAARRASIFDGSQYLTNILTGDYPNPLAQGFDLLVASTHKNFPGPQKALLATRYKDEIWQEVLTGVSTYVSNMHVGSIYAAGLTLARQEWLALYSQRIVSVAVLLEEALSELGVPVVRRPKDLPATHHLWIREDSRDRAFRTYEHLEKCAILTNYRRLPYSLGHGVRLGVSAAVRLGLVEADVPALAELVATARSDPDRAVIAEAKRFAQMLWAREDAERHDDEVSEPEED
jgi:glycine hydroxymethyltransferase